MKFGAQNETIASNIESLFSSILQEQVKFDKVLPANNKFREENKLAIESLASTRGRPLFYPYISTGRGHGPFTELLDGSIKFDLIGAIGVNLFGHSHPIYIKSNLEAATYDCMMCGNLLPYEITSRVSQNLLSIVKDSRLKHFWFSGSGSFANDNALKMIWQKKAPAHRVFALKQGFSGRSIATQELTDNLNYRAGMPKHLSVTHIPNFDYKDEEGCIKNALSCMKEQLNKYPSEYCAISCEIVQGEGGLNIGSKKYYEAIFSLAKDNDLFVWVDEVQTFGRTPEPFAFQTLGLQGFVDVVTVGKALQACGTLFSEELNPKPGLISGTFNGSIASLLCSDKILKFMLEGNLYGESGRIREIEKNFSEMLEKLKNKHPSIVKEIFSLGTMFAMEIDDLSVDSTKKYLHALFANGIIAFSAGSNPCRVRFLLPICLETSHIDDIYDILDKSISEVF